MEKVNQMYILFIYYNLKQITHSYMGFWVFGVLNFGEGSNI